MISQQAPRTLRIGHRKKKKKKYKHGLVLLTLVWGILVGAGARAYFEQGDNDLKALPPYTEIAQPAIQDANRISELYTALILQAQTDPRVMEQEHWVQATSESIEEMDSLITDLRDTETYDEATRLHRKNTIEAYAVYTTAMEKIRNGMVIHSDSLIEEGEQLIEQADQLVKTMEQTIP